MERLFRQPSYSKDWIWKKCTSSCLPSKRLAQSPCTQRKRTVRRKYGHLIDSSFSDAPLIEAVSTYGLFFFDDKLLASDTDVAFIAPEVAQVPAFIHCYRVLSSENQLRRKMEKKCWVHKPKFTSFGLQIKTIALLEHFIYFRFRLYSQSVLIFPILTILHPLTAISRFCST